MKIEKQVTTLKQSGILDSLGIKMQQGQYYWVAFSTASGQEFVLCRPASHIEEHSREWAWFMVGEHSEEIQAELDEDTVNADGMIYNAFTLSELGQMLGYENVPYFSTEYDTWMLPKGSKLKGQGFGSVNECEIRAELLIFALENKLLSAETCNSRLVE